MGQCQKYCQFLLVLNQCHFGFVVVAKMKVFTFVVFCVIVSLGLGTALLDQDRKKPSPRIIGGHNTPIEDYPYVVTIGQNVYRHICGGVLIGPKTVLTAAHCVGRSSHDTDDNLDVRAGSSNRVIGGIRMDIKQIIIHPNYNVHANDYDIAILQLRQNVVLPDNNVQTIEMWDQGTTFPAGTEGTLLGWGVTEQYNRTSPRLLQSVDVRIFNHDCCQIIWRYKANERNICTLSEGKDFCYGDTGGPFVVNGKLAGIPSFFAACGQLNGIPNVLSSIPAYRSWIKETAGI